jgi:transcription elongation factor GreB
MNKAFIINSDEESEEPGAPPRSAQLPPGIQNYMTPDGARRMREELDRLKQAGREQRTSKDTLDAGTKRELFKLNQRMLYLEECLRTAVVASGSTQPPDSARFGASVLVRDLKGNEIDYRIVGVDEIDLTRDWISWLSPLAKALMNKRVGDTVQYHTPRGEEKLTVLRVSQSQVAKA